MGGGEIKVEGELSSDFVKFRTNLVDKSKRFKGKAVDPTSIQNNVNTESHYQGCKQLTLTA